MRPVSCSPRAGHEFEYRPLPSTIEPLCDPSRDAIGVVAHEFGASGRLKRGDWDGHFTESATHCPQS